MTQPSMFEMEPIAPPPHRAGKRWGGRASTNARAQVKTMLPAPCTRCGGLVTEDMDWHADHITERTFGGGGGGNLGPAHAGCNTAAGGKIGAAITNSRRITPDVIRERTAKWW